MENKDLIQSYILTSSKYDYSVHEKRILYRLVEVVQNQLTGKKLNKDFKVDRTLFQDYIVEMKVRDFMKEGELNKHQTIKETFKKLRNRTIEIDDKKRQVLKIVGIIDKVEYYYNKNQSFVKIQVDKDIWEVILDFSKGFSKYQLQTTFNLESKYSMRFSELISHNKTPITYTIQTLREMLKLEGKYSKNKDFIKRVIEPSKKELDEKHNYSFEYKVNKKGRSFYSITFYPYHIVENQDPETEKRELNKQTSMRWVLPQVVIDYLREVYKFNDRELKSNIDLLKTCYITFDLLDFLSDKKRVMLDKKNPKGYLIQSLKNKLKQQEEYQEEPIDEVMRLGESMRFD